MTVATATSNTVLLLRNTTDFTGISNECDVTKLTPVHIAYYMTRNRRLWKLRLEE